METKISILTPTWNRGSYLPKVWEGLSQQTFKDFEWIIANDGSEDNTIEVVRELAKKSQFSVILINANMRIGKSRMDNELVKSARGEFILWCDSDDVLYPNALEVLIKTWNAIPEIDRHDFMGITALCHTNKEGILGREIPNALCNDMTLNSVLLSLNSDLVIFTRADLLKKAPFLEVDFLISESSVWSIIGIKLTRFIPVVLKQVTYGEPNCLSYSKLMEYNRGKAYSMALTLKFLKTNITWKNFFFRTINFLRYSFHGDIGLAGAFKLWSQNSGSAFALFLCLPIAYSLVIKDTMQGKVRKTHREFDVAKRLVKINTQILHP